MALAKTVLTRDSHHIPTALGFGGQPFVQQLQFTDDREKAEAYIKTGVLTYLHKSEMLVLVNECAARTYDSEAEAKQAIQNYETERPTLYPESMRKELLMVVVLDFRFNTIFMQSQEYKITPDGPVFGEFQEADSEFYSQIVEFIGRGRQMAKEINEPTNLN